MDQTALISSNITDSGSSESSEPMNLAMSDSITSGNNYLTLHNGGTQTQQSNLPAHAIANNSNNCVEQGHSRNSSNTSQVSTHSTHILFFFISNKIKLKNIFSLLNISDVQRIRLQ